MGTSFVGIGGHGFWMTDGILELWLRLLALHVDDPVEDDSLETKIRNQWLLASRGYFGGCVPDGLEDAVATEAGKTIVVQAIHALLKCLEKAPQTINKDVLNLLGFSNPFVLNIETQRLIEVANAYLDLIDGKIQTDARDTSFMPGCR